MYQHRKLADLQHKVNKTLKLLPIQHAYLGSSCCTVAFRPVRPYLYPPMSSPPCALICPPSNRAHMVLHRPRRPLWLADPMFRRRVTRSLLMRVTETWLLLSEKFLAEDCRGCRDFATE